MSFSEKNEKDDKKLRTSKKKNDSVTQLISDNIQSRKEKSKNENIIGCSGRMKKAIDVKL